ncbi:hypothetical protein HUJ05_003300 [Dendroctonus ponderosae]|nr:hypothetical protein HUJ05_003300 [Dendroctonus ponderosae]
MNNSVSVAQRKDNLNYYFPAQKRGNIQLRLQAFAASQIAPDQAGFLKGRGTREQILNLRQLIEKAREYYTPMNTCVVDYVKAFDREESTAVVRVDIHLSAACKIRKGVRQGCVFSPLLFSLYSESIMRYVLDDWDGGVTISGKKISNLRFADDTLLLARSEDEL